MRSSLPRVLLALGVAAAGVIAAVTAGSPASANTVSVIAEGTSFTPAKLKVALGTEVLWDFQGPASHTTTSRQGFWSSALKPTGTNYRFTFQTSGTYPYYCQPHESLGMTGRVRVPMAAHQKVSGAWVIRWSVLSTTPSNRSFDVQIKRPGAQAWKGFRSGTSAAKTVFDPAASGVYRFRARTRNLADATKSGWSPVRRVSVS